MADDTHAYALDIQTIKGKPGYFRLRSGSYRVIYYKDEDAPEGKTILVVGIKHRSDAYA